MNLGFNINNDHTKPWNCAYCGKHIVATKYWLSQEIMFCDAACGLHWHKDNSEKYKAVEDESKEARKRSKKKNNRRR